jgi:phage FluMu protein Com
MENAPKNLLFRNHCANCNQTLVEWSLHGPLPKLCPVIPTFNQDGRQAKNKKKGDKI